MTSATHTGLVRSWLIAPANVERRATKALNCAADAGVLDLEDAVAISEKPGARALAVERLRAPRKARGYVRVNAYEEGCFHDLAAIVGPWLDGIMLPKAEDAQSMRSVDWVLRQLEAGCGMTPGTIDLVPIVETCAGVARAAEIGASTPRIRRLAFGGGDFTRDMGVPWGRDESELAQARFHVVVASKTAGIEQPIDTVFVDLTDDAGLAASVARGVGAGFGSKCCIHPEQVAAIHAGFAPAAAAVAEARQIVESFAKAEAEGSAAYRLNGKLVDYAIAKRAQDLLAIAERHHLADRRA